MIKNLTLTPYLYIGAMLPAVKHVFWIDEEYQRFDTRKRIMSGWSYIKELEFVAPQAGLDKDFQLISEDKRITITYDLPSGATEDDNKLARVKAIKNFLTLDRGQINELGNN